VQHSLSPMDADTGTVMGHSQTFGSEMPVNIAHIGKVKRRQIILWLPRYFSETLRGTSCRPELLGETSTTIAQHHESSAKRRRLVICYFSFVIFLPTLGMFSDPLSSLFFVSETLDYFRLAIRPENIDHPAKSGIFPRHESGPMLEHPPNMRLRQVPIKPVSLP
jgi:hypothetical protein